jgi:hypothetical protein
MMLHGFLIHDLDSTFEGSLEDNLFDLGVLVEDPHDIRGDHSGCLQEFPIYLEFPGGDPLPETQSMVGDFGSPGDPGIDIDLLQADLRIIPIGDMILELALADKHSHLLFLI